MAPRGSSSWWVMLSYWARSVASSISSSPEKIELTVSRLSSLEDLELSGTGDGRVGGISGSIPAARVSFQGRSLARSTRLAF